MLTGRVACMGKPLEWGESSEAEALLQMLATFKVKPAPGGLKPNQTALGLEYVKTTQAPVV